MWSRFFCLSVYVTMYLNDHQRSAFYGALGLNTRQYDQHIIIETNKSAERVFPQVRRERLDVCLCVCSVLRRVYHFRGSMCLPLHIETTV